MATKTLHVVSGTLRAKPFARAFTNFDKALVYARVKYNRGALLFWSKHDLAASTKKQADPFQLSLL